MVPRGLLEFSEAFDFGQADHGGEIKWAGDPVDIAIIEIEGGLEQ